MRDDGKGAPALNFSVYAHRAGEHNRESARNKAEGAPASERGALRGCWQGWTRAPIWRTGCGFAGGAGGGAHPYGVDQVRRPGGTPWTPQKNETVILVIFGYFWLFLSPIFVVTNCRKTTCVDFAACTPGEPGFRGLSCEKFANKFGMHGSGGVPCTPLGARLHEPQHDRPVCPSGKVTRFFRWPSSRPRVADPRSGGSAREAPRLKGSKPRRCFSRGKIPGAGRRHWDP
jgi:hypothetical protein